MKTITAVELFEKIKLHRLWLNCESGARLVLEGYDLIGSDLSDSNLRYSKLSGSDLSNSDLRGSDLRGSNLRDSKLRGSDLSDSDLRGSDLRDSDLRGSNLRDSDLSNSDLDFSAFPLWCGGSKFTCSEKLVQQLFAHICTLTIADASDGMKRAIESIKHEARKSHRANDLGIKE